MKYAVRDLIYDVISYTAQGAAIWVK